MNYYFKIVRKSYSYKNIPALLGLANFLLLILAVLLVFLLLVYEPANEWHTTTFTLSHYEYRYSRGAVLDLYTTDGRRYALNQNAETIRYQLKEGQLYHAVYSDDFFCDTVRGLTDTEGEYLNSDETKKLHTTERFWFHGLLRGCFLILLTANSLYAIFCVIEEEEKRRKRINKRR